MKNIIKPILFIIILFIIMCILSYIFIPKNNTKEAGMKEFGAQKILGEKANTVDMVAFGNSESFTSFIPMELWEKYGYTSYICGNPGQTLPDVLETLYNVTKNQKPKVIVLEANVIYDEVSITVPIARVVQTILPITKYHDRWKNLHINDFYSPKKYTETDYIKGFHYKTIKEPADVNGYMSYTEEKREIRGIEKLYVKMINEYCKNNDAKLIIISVPSPKNWNYQKHNAVKDFSEEEQIDFIDFNLLTDELEIDWNNDTLDSGDHMNFYGSKKITNYFGKYISDKKLLPSHKDDPNYDKWNKDLEKYKEKIKNKE